MKKFICVIIVGFVTLASAQSTSFTYHGQLMNGGSPVSGTNDFVFRLWNVPSGGGVALASVTNLNVPLSNGVFTVLLDFGANSFPGANRWLEIETRPVDGGGFVLLAPRQSITPTPYALRAFGASAGSIDSTALANGSVTSVKLASNAITQLSSPDGTPLNAVQVNTNGLVGIGTSAPEAGLHIVNGSTILTPFVFYQRQLGYTNIDYLSALAVQNNVLAVGGGWTSGRIILYSLTNAASPTQITNTSYLQPGLSNLSAYTLVFRDSNVLVAGGWNGVTVLGFTNNGPLVRLAALNDGAGGWNEIAGVADLAVSGNLLAIASQQDSAVTLADISNGAAPVLRSTMKDGQFGFDYLSSAQAVSLSGSLLAIGSSGESAVTLVDVSNPAIPVKRAELRHNVGGYTALSNVYDVALSGSLLAIAGNYSDAVTLVDVSNPASPVLLAEIREDVNGIDSLRRPHRLAFSGNRLFVSATWDNTVTMFDITVPTNPKVLGVARHGNNGANLFKDPYYHVGPENIILAGTNVIAASYWGSAMTILTFRPAEAGLFTDGWVGIGTTHPNAPLHVVGSVIVEGAKQFEVDAESVRLGLLSTAVADGSVAIGRGAYAEGPYSVALGGARATGNSALATGYSLAAGRYSFSGGYDTYAGGQYAVALGYSTEAGGEAAVALGSGAEAYGDYSFAVGLNSLTSGNYSFAAGATTLASGDYTFALGNRARAIHGGAFVWADSQNATYTSSGSNTFNVRASGGVFLNATGAVNVTANNALRFYSPHSITLDTANTVYMDCIDIYVDANDVSITAPDGLFVDANFGMVLSGATRLFAGNTLRQVINMVGSNYGVGVQSSTLYFRSGSAFSWFQDGVHTNTQFQPGTGGLEMMRLESDGDLLVRGNITANAALLTSDRNAKENFASINSAEILAKVIALPITRWNYTNDAKTRHIGPVAQDFHASFGVGLDDKHIATVDADGVALAAIQGLNEKVEKQNAQLKQRDAEIERLTTAVDELRRAIAQMQKQR